MKKFLLFFLTLIGFWSITSSIQATQVAPQRVSVHDPSIFYDSPSKKYYIFGSHLAQAKSDDLLNWQAMFTHEYENPSSILGNLEGNLSKVFEWAGHNDADTANGGYAVWASDVIYNPQYRWADQSQGAYMYYFSSSSTWKRSVIGYAVSKSVEGPYQFVDTLVYSGFTYNDATDGSDKNVKYTNTNIDELIEENKISNFNTEKWNWPDGKAYFTDYAPNAIDPHPFFDKDGQLWMTYGSWSGGIFLLQLDATTGQAKYPGSDSVNQAGQVVDQYFGTHLLGGYHQSGEAPYIVYDAKTNYYYLFVTYGGLTRTGGYNMRVFRSETPDGLYVDAKGQHPTYDHYTAEPINDEYGIKVMGNYQFDCLPQAYMSPGHNSVLIDEQGRWFLVYHTRFDAGSEYHEVRVHQMLMSENGWPMAVPFEYTGKEKQFTDFKALNFSGTYEFVNHGTNTGKTAIPKAKIKLNADGSVSGDFVGTWQKNKVDDYNYQLTLIDQNKQKYHGQFFIQQDESTERKDVLVFTAVGENNQMLWGSKPISTEETNGNANLPTTPSLSTTKLAKTIEKATSITPQKGYQFEEKTFSKLTEQLKKAKALIHTATSQAEIDQADQNLIAALNQLTSQKILKNVFRLYNQSTGEHFYTQNEVEQNVLIAVGWQDEKIAWQAAEVGQAVYRLYNPFSKEHFYTQSSQEKEHLVQLGWKDENIGFYMNDEKDTPIYRLFNPNEKRASSHHFTQSLAEVAFLVNLGWKNEGIAFYSF